MRYAVFNAPDGLAVRAAPGVAAPELGRWPDGAAGITATGQRRKVGRAVWAEVQGAGLTGWVNQSYLSEER